jgi:hypothetical protein
MGIASVIAAVLIVLKACGVVTLAWGWCFLGFGVDILLLLGIVVAGYFWGKKVVKAVDGEFDKGFDAMETRFNKAKDRLG